MISLGNLLRMREMVNVYRILVGKPERKREFGRAGRTREDNINELQENNMKDVDLIHLALDVS